MSTQVRRCCVPGCTDKVSKRHVITRIETCRKIWLERINNPRMSFTNYSATYRICEAHFQAECFISGKLNKLALPTLNLKDYVRTGSDYLFSPPGPNGRATPTIIRELLQLAPSTLFDHYHHLTVKKPVFTYLNRRRPVDVDKQVDEHLFNEQTDLDEKAASARISQQLSTNLVTSQENLENVSEKKSPPSCFLLKEHLNLVPEYTEIPFIMCDTDTGNSTGFLKKSLECRTCLEILTDDNKICLDTEVVAKITILEALKKLANIQVPETDLLPQQICDKCFRNLQIAVNFTTQVISSDEKLKSRLPSLIDPLLIKSEPGVIETEEFNTLNNNVNKPLEDIKTEPFKKEVVEENIERFASSESIDVSNADAIEKDVNRENESVDDYLKKENLYESTIPIEPPEESFKKLPPKEIVHPEYMVDHNVVGTPNVSDNSCLCPECGKIFRTRIECQIHVNRMHNRMIRASDKARLCPKCGKMFYTKKGCQQHISGNRTKILAHMAGHSNKYRRIRTRHRSCLCPECGKIFKSKWNCNIHLREVHYKNMTVVPRKRTTLCIDCGRSISGSKKHIV